MADGGVAAAPSVSSKRFKAHSGVATGISTGIGFERCVTNGGIFGSGCVMKKRVTPDSYVIGPLGVGKKRTHSIGSILPSDRVCEESVEASGGVSSASVLLKRALAP